MSEQDYPTEEDLQRIREWPSTDLDGSRWVIVLPSKAKAIGTK
jgi:hypothetical protein